MALVLYGFQLFGKHDCHSRRALIVSLKVPSNSKQLMVLVVSCHLPAPIKRYLRKLSYLNFESNYCSVIKVDVVPVIRG